MAEVVAVPKWRASQYCKTHPNQNNVARNKQLGGSRNPNLNLCKSPSHNERHANAANAPVQ
eukprot:6339513-Karenia_brevis.AAC.1